MADLPDVPTMIESGYPKVIGTNHWAIFGPAGMPDAVVNKLNGEINEIIRSDEFRTNLKKIGADPMGGSPQQFSSLLADEFKTWAPIVKATGFRLE